MTVQQSVEDATAEPKVDSAGETVTTDDAPDLVKADQVELSLRTEPDEVRPGATTRLIVTATITPGWHIYAVDQPAGVALPTRLTLQLPDGVRQSGEWTLPDAQLSAAPGSEPQFTYHDTVEFACPLTISADSRLSEVRIGCMVNVQACDERSCAPPAEVVLETRLRVGR